MRYGIFSDVHSNLEALEAVINAYKKESIDKYLCVGDIVGYAANPNECISKIETLTAKSIAGNHDWASVDLFSSDYFNPAAKEAILWTAVNLDDKNRAILKSLQLTYVNEDLTLVHGILEKPAEFNYMLYEEDASETFRLLKTRICFVGHTHVPGIFIEDKEGKVFYQQTNSIEIRQGLRYIVNVGSVGQPRNEDRRAAYCIYDTGKMEIQIKRVDYDIETSRKKIIAMGLPRFLGDRLLVGR